MWCCAAMVLVTSAATSLYVIIMCSVIFTGVIVYKT